MCKFWRNVRPYCASDMCDCVAVQYTKVQSLAKEGNGSLLGHVKFFYVDHQINLKSRFSYPVLAGQWKLPNSSGELHYKLTEISFTYALSHHNRHSAALLLSPLVFRLGLTMCLSVCSSLCICHRPLRIKVQTWMPKMLAAPHLLIWHLVMDIHRRCSASWGPAWYAF